MGEPSLRELEHDVEIARSKLARDLSTLRSPNTYSQFSSTLQHEALSAKDAIIDNAKARVQSTVESFVEELKAKAAANPTAALAIGAGIAWRLIHRPPIATVLVGAGLISLFRTQATPIHGATTSDYVEQATGRLRDQASAVAADIKDRAQRALEAGTEQASALATDVKDRAQRAFDSGKEQVVDAASTMKARAGAAVDTAAEYLGDATQTAQARVQEFAGQAASAVQDAGTQVQERAVSSAGHAMDKMSDLRRSVGHATDAVSQRLADGSARVQNAVQDQQARDTVLLGVAGLAVVAALGIASQRRLSEPAD